jgi:hypothetical protein
MKSAPLAFAFLFCIFNHMPSVDGQDVVEKYQSAAIERWNNDIQKLETLDKEETHPSDAILFIGSSSIRLWKDIATDMQPYSAIRRGYGGAKFTDLAVFAERMVTPHKYKALVVFVANDIQGKPEDTPLEDIEKLVRHIIDVSHQHQPDAQVFLIEVTPTPKRFAVWSKIREVNQILRELALTVPNTQFIATAPWVLDSQKVPQANLFIEDQLHLNRDGYLLWAKIIKQHLANMLR